MSQSASTVFGEFYLKFCLKHCFLLTTSMSINCYRSDALNLNHDQQVNFEKSHFWYGSDAGMIFGGLQSDTLNSITWYFLHKILNWCPVNRFKEGNNYW